MDSYSVLKTFHVIGVVLFLGNIIVTGWWKTMADMTRSPAIIAFAQRQVTLTDWVFTAGGILLILAGGIGNALLHGMALTTPWMLAGNALFTASGVIWVAILIPLQIRLARLTRDFRTADALPAAYWRMERLWLGFGLLAILLPTAAIPVMVFKAV